MTRTPRTRLPAPAHTGAALAAIRKASSYGELEKLAGVTDRIAFWEPYGDNEGLARTRLHEMAYERLTAAQLETLAGLADQRA